MKAPLGPMRIVHLVSSLKVGGMEQFVLRIAAVQSADHRVTVLALQDGPLREEARGMGLAVHVLGGSQKHLRALRGAALLARLRPDIAHAHNQTSLHYAVLAKRVAGAKVVMTNHGQGMGSPRTPSALEWRDTDSIIAVSQAVADRMRDAGVADKVSVILNGVETKAPMQGRAETRKALGLSAGVVGLMVARIDGFKGHDALLQALAALKAKGVLLTVLIAGDGAQRKNMEELAGSLGLNGSHIRFLGFRSDVPDLHEASDFFLLPSLTEGLPLSVLEAMAAGKPVVATRVGGIPELVEDGEHGFLVPVGDNEALTRAIETLVRDANLRERLGRAGLDRVTTDFSFTQMKEKYLSLYGRLLNLPAGKSD